MLNEFLKTVVKTFDGGTAGTVYLSVASTGVKAEFQAAAPIRLFKWGIIATTAIESQTAATQLSLIQRTAPGVTSGQTTVDTLTLGANATSPYSVLAVGLGAYRDPWTTSTQATTPASQPANAGPEGETFYIYSGQQQLVLLPGQAYAINVVTAPDVQGAGILFLEYTLLPIAKPSGYSSAVTGGTGDTSLTDNLTRYAS